jgi:polyhydroxybutyrate depolymerase
MKRVVLVLLVVGFAIIGGSCARRAPLPSAMQQHSSLSAGDHSLSLAYANRERKYLVHIPAAISASKLLPLVIILHGGGGNAENAIRMTGMSEKADQASFIAAYPDGTGRLGDKLLTWNSGNCCGYALDNNIDDVGFVLALINKLQGDYPIDPKRIYATGISNGGMMAYRLGCELSDKLAAIAPVAGALNVECEPTQPVSVIAFHGTSDRNVLYDGGVPKLQIDSHTREDKSVAYAMSFWSQQDGCMSSPYREESSNIIHEIYPNCAKTTGVELYTIKGGGHAWPGGDRTNIILDAPTDEISATELMWDFFAAHPKQ